jgi:hypothetical protein
MKTQKNVEYYGSTKAKNYKRMQTKMHMRNRTGE